MQFTNLNISPSQTIFLLCVLPVALFAAYISWLIVPEILRVVVPEVVQAVTDLFS
jgi:hypothetical protein